jgi:hypothetical protein
MSNPRFEGALYHQRQGGKKFCCEKLWALLKRLFRAMIAL